MLFRSTRSSASTARRDVAFLPAVEAGLAPDGGLFMPVDLPRLPPPPPYLPLTAAETAAWAAPLLLGAGDGAGVDADEERAPRTPAGSQVAPGAEEWRRIARESLDFPIPLTPLGTRIRLLELFHGPTLAFKDVGARFLARVLSRGGEEAGMGGKRAGAGAGKVSGHPPGPLTILVATSGDTGGAVARAVHGLPGLRVAVLFPRQRVSAVQRHQFTTLGGNVLALEVDGPFDVCQALVKEALGDGTLVQRHRLTSANSINPGRLIPQVFYYLHLARLLGWGGVGEVERPPVVVPSGNLGNVTAGVLAVRAGAPLGPLVAALNANDALLHFQADGTTREVPVVPTLSTAMDVGRPSNLERLEDLFHGDREALAGALPTGSVSDDETRKTMAWAWREHGVHLDPHTAVGVAMARREPWSGNPAVVLATAHPAKFPDVVREATGVEPTPPAELARSTAAPEEMIPLDGNLTALAEALERWDGRGEG